MSYQELLLKKCIELVKYNTLFLRDVPEELRTPEMCMEAVKNDGYVLEYVPEELRTPEMCMKAVKNKGYALRDVPEELRTPEMYMEAVKNNGYVLEYVPEELRTPEMCMEAVKNKGYALRDVPEELRTPEMCMEAVKNDGYVLEYVPEELRTPEMCMEAVKNNGKALRDVPEELRTPEMCMEAVKNDGYALYYVPEELKTAEMCMEAIKSGVMVLAGVPKKLRTSEMMEKAYSSENKSEKFRTAEMCMEAVKNNGTDLYYVPEEFRTAEMCMEAVKNRGTALEYVPEELRTPEMYMEAVKNRGTALYYVSEELKTAEMCMEAVKNDGTALEYVPEEFRTAEMCMEAVKNDGTALEYVPEEFRTAEMCMEAVKNDGTALAYVPEEFRTAEIYMEAIKSNGKALAYVPEEFKTPEVYMEAVKNDGKALAYVPEEFRTAEMCMEAVKNSGTALAYVPEEMRTLDMYIDGIITKSEELNKILQMCKKADKFKEVCHFIPSVNVLEKYPIDQIEKFNKKIWFNMARNELYNVNIDTKKSLVEVALSFGVFDKDANQLERIGLIQKMATYIPKDEALVVSALDEFTKGNFEVVGREKIVTYHINKEKLLADPNIINLFGSREKAEAELDALTGKLSLEDMEKALNIDTTDENTSDNYKKVMTYIYKLGYDKAEQDKGYIIKLKTDIQQEKIKDKKRGQELENKIRQFYYTNGSKLIMTPEKLHRIFDGMDMKYKPGFYEFFRDNYEQILADTEKQSEISKIQNQWDKIVEANLGQKINFEKCEAYIYSHVYENVGEDELEIAKLASNCGYSQEQFEQVQEIFNEQKKRTQSSIPQIEKNDAKTGYTYKVLRLDDPTAIFVGELTDCCQALGIAGESCMRHSVTSPNGRILVVQDEEGKILSQSWIWRNKNTICFDNIEAIKKTQIIKKL